MLNLGFFLRFFENRAPGLNVRIQAKHVLPPTASFQSNFHTQSSSLITSWFTTPFHWHVAFLFSRFYFRQRKR